MQPSGLQALDQFQRRCRDNHHRGLVVVSGSLEWTTTTANTILKSLPHLTFKTIEDGVSATKLLGDETAGILFNAFYGLNLNALAISAGTIKGGGLLILLCPALEKWSGFNDPEYQRLLAHPYTAADVDGRFLQRFQQQLKDDTNTIIVTEGRPERTFEIPKKINTSHAVAIEPYANLQQAESVEAILSIINQEQHAVIITADRGRGKSTALGFAAAKLLQQDNIQIVLTAPSPNATKAVFKHAINDDIQASKNRLKTKTSQLRFISPDELILKLPSAQILFIDEAAAIPIPLLIEILAHYPRVVLTTTVHGYEGTGRAFSERFGKLLDEQKLTWSKHELQMPIRFATQDPLEDFIHNSLILNSSLETRYSATNTHCALLDRDQLVTDEDQLRELFGLLMLAHYKTRPDDLRHLLDAPNLDVFVIKSQEQILGTAMVAREGQLDENLILSIMAGKRRPKGHLLPQTLAFYCHLPEAAKLSSARVIRIAIHPGLQRRGLGNQLLTHIEKHYQDSNTDIIGSSFGLEPGIQSFWQQAGYDCVRVGQKRNAASGYLSGLLIKGLCAAGEKICLQAKNQHQQENELSND